MQNAAIREFLRWPDEETVTLRIWELLLSLGTYENRDHFGHSWQP